ncbi:hypothetical protein BJV82DRAFT_317320 [Fennellomyces sp. T-0311]|nr:hypothetical protein BJV82DRAFT_317320 [Fennellomyces sp. T-0311]
MVGAGGGRMASGGVAWLPKCGVACARCPKQACPSQACRDVEHACGAIIGSMSAVCCPYSSGAPQTQGTSGAHIGEHRRSLYPLWRHALLNHNYGVDVGKRSKSLHPSTRAKPRQPSVPVASRIILSIGGTRTRQMFVWREVAQRLSIHWARHKSVKHLMAAAHVCLSRRRWIALQSL